MFVYKVARNYGSLHVFPGKLGYTRYRLYKRSVPDPELSELGFGLCAYRDPRFAVQYDRQDVWLTVYKCWAEPHPNPSRYRLCAGAFQILDNDNIYYALNGFTAWSYGGNGFCLNEQWPEGTILCASITPYYTMSLSEILSAQAQER